MEQIVMAPPPLPPKTRRAPPDSATVLPGSTDVFEYRFPEVHAGSSSSSVGTGNHVVKIRINPQESETVKGETASVCDVAPCITISVNSDSEMIQRSTMTENFIKATPERSNPYFFYSAIMSSGQVSPSDTLDSGTCSDLDGTPPPLPKKKNAGVSVTVIGAEHKRTPSLASSGADLESDDESNISCDSLNSAELAEEIKIAPQPSDNASAFLPQGLLRDIRDRSAKLSPVEADEESQEPPKTVIDENTYEQRKQLEKDQQQAEAIRKLLYDTDRFYDFHLNEHEFAEPVAPPKKPQEDSFAGYKDLLGEDGSSTIRSAKGTIRGVKNRVRAGIATFLQINSTTKSYKEKDAGKVVVYTTTMGIVRETYNACMMVKQIMRTLLVKFEERDVFMSNESQAEIKDRMRCDYILVPQVFVDGQHIGDAETVERLNESGELRRMLKPYKSLDACTTCKSCGGYRLLPCPVCNGSKKSVHRNDFTTEFVALKCMNCDEVGLVRCSYC